jgi:serine/threonine protein kinase/lipoprotein NlpI
MNEETLFHEALQLSTCQRRVFLSARCEADPDLQQKVEALLDAHDQAGDFMNGPTRADSIRGSRRFREGPGSRIGPYTLGEQLGEGGFGVVFRAEQQVPVHRQVALKIIKPGMDSRQVVARFQAERQALALMQHPNIAQVLDAGTTDSGLPFFVMELIRGEPITAYCRACGHDLRTRLSLFATVCRAVQHAHQKGIIHRDIKPSNIIVTTVDGQPVPKVIDFGIAKAIDQRLTDDSIATDMAFLIGTPKYMSPEQVDGLGRDIDTRCDIYALGVVLYELLTGTTPLERSHLDGMDFERIRRAIVETEPARPSARLATGAQTTQQHAAPGLAADRKLIHEVRGDLDWIVMKAIEKDRNRRYASAVAMAEDIEAYLRNEPVRARPPSASYRLRKLVQRNRGVFAASVFLTLALFATLIGLLLTNAAIRREQSRTSEERRQAEAARRLAEQRSDEIRKGLDDFFAANHLLERARLEISREYWDDAEAALTRAIELRPEYSVLWNERAELYRRLGLFDLAVRDLNRAYRLQKPSLPTPHRFHAIMLRHVGDDHAARPIITRMRSEFEGTPQHGIAMETILTSALLPGSPAECEYDTELGRVLVDATPQNPWFHYGLGAALYRAGGYSEALEELITARTIDPNWTSRDMVLPMLAMTYFKLGRKDEADAALARAGAALEAWSDQRLGHWKGNWAVHFHASEEWPVFWWDWLECKVYCDDATRLITGREPAPDYRMKMIRARGFSALRRRGEAIAEYESALAIQPDLPRVQFELHLDRGYQAGYRDWSLAAREFGLARKLEPNEFRVWALESIARLAAGDRAGYQALCSEMLDHFGDTTDPVAAHEVVFACVLSPQAVDDPARLLPLAELASRYHHGNERVLGAAYYRAGDHERAADCLERSARFFKPRGWELSFRAMALFKHGDAAGARKYLAQARAWISEAERQDRLDLTVRERLWGGFNERFEFPLLLEEASTLIDP